MSSFRKKPVVIEAVRVAEVLEAAEKNWAALPDWLREAYERGGVVFATPGPKTSDRYISLPTLEGTMRADYDDWIIRGVQGELYPCKPDIFEATYEPL